MQREPSYDVEHSDRTILYALDIALAVGKSIDEAKFTV